MMWKEGILGVGKTEEEVGKLPSVRVLLCFPNFKMCKNP